MTSNKPITAATLSVKHLDHLYPDPSITPRGMGKSKWTPANPYVDRPGFAWGPNEFGKVNNASLSWNPALGRYVWATEVVMMPSRFVGRSALWDALFGKPFGFVSDRFTRPFESRLIGFTRNYTLRHNMKSYWAMDWLTNIFVPRINQYDPVNYMTYCEKHLKYSPVRKSEWVVGLEMFNLDSLSWATSIRCPLEKGPYEVDEACKERLAQMFPVKPTTRKRII